MPVVADLFEDAFAIHLLLETPKRLFDWLTFLKFNLGHAESHPFPTLAVPPAPIADGPCRSGQNGGKGYGFLDHSVNRTQ